MTNQTSKPGRTSSAQARLETEVEQLQRQVRQLQDRQAILDCLTRYTRAIDRHDWPRLETVYHADAVADHGWFVGNRDDIARTLKEYYERALKSHVHLIANHSCEIEGDTAHTETTAVTYCQLRDGGKIEMAGWRYVDRLERRDGVWKIALRTIALDWRGRVEVDGPAPLDHASPAGRWDRQDVSYLRPLELSEDRRRLYEASHEKTD